MMDIEASQLDQLDDRQQRQVAENLGLVAVHLRRHLPSGTAPLRTREWEDLFQEGCLGLIQAVKSFPADSGIAFPAYALPRIHTAVSRAMRGAFSTVRQPIYPTRRSADEARPTPPTVFTLDFDPQDRRPDPRHAVLDDASGDTIADRLRRRYVQAVDRVARRMRRSRPAREDRAEVIDRIVEQRLLVPEPEARLSLRAIARATNSSYARIAKCEKRIVSQLRAELADDAETQYLRQAARRNPAGMAAAIDAALTDEIERARIDHFLTRLAAAPPDRQGAVLLSLITAADIGIEPVARSLLAGMPPQRRAEFLANS
jgi:RNA polymerase sigma factor (sigma-70 family)